METPRFQETSGINRIVLLVMTLLVAVVFYAQWHEAIGRGDFGGMAVPLGIAAVVLAVVWLARFTVRITGDGRIEYRFFPFHFKTYRIMPQDVAEMHVRKYTMMGWGIRYYFFEKMTAYMLSGNRGLEVKLRSGRKVLFGTPRAPEMMQHLQPAASV